MRWEADRVISVELRAPDGADLPEWDPGAHVDLMLPDVITRQYSLSSDPADRTMWRISVLRELAGRGGSAAVHDALRVGQLVEVVGPRNNFPLEPSEKYLFIAGGIGITPIVPMLRAARSAGARTRLVYGGRTRAGLAHLGEVRTLCDDVVVHPQDELGHLDLVAELGEPRDGVLVYCCGPEPLLAAVEERCQGWPPGSLHVERFAPRPQEHVDPDQESSFEAVLERSGTSIVVQPGQTILEAMEEQGLDHVSSCREGICGTCETSVISGTPDHRDSLLSDDERAAGDTMMICVGRALSERIVLDL
jgi:ferredoxin-NADP reductase